MKASKTKNQFQTDLQPQSSLKKTDINININYEHKSTKSLRQESFKKQHQRTFSGLSQRSGNSRENITQLNGSD